MVPGTSWRALVTDVMQASQWRGTAKVVWKGGMVVVEVEIAAGVGVGAGITGGGGLGWDVRRRYEGFIRINVIEGVWVN